MSSFDIAITADLTALDALIDGIDGRIAAIVEKYADLIVQEAQAIVPVATGALRASITSHLNGWTAEIAAGEGLDYAVLIEYGTVRHRAQPFIRPAVERYAAGFIREIQAALGG
jgi:HK97 gp10 family phage protein